MIYKQRDTTRHLGDICRESENELVVSTLLLGRCGWWTTRRGPPVSPRRSRATCRPTPRPWRGPSRRSSPPGRWSWPWTSPENISARLPSPPMISRIAPPENIPRIPRPEALRALEIILGARSPRVARYWAANRITFPTVYKWTSLVTCLVGDESIVYHIFN